MFITYCLKRLVLLCILCASSFACAAQCVSDSVRAIFEGRILDPIEGVWQFPGDGATLLITRASSTTFDIVLLDSPDLDMPPNSLIGNAKQAPKAKHYDVKLDNAKLKEKRIKRSTIEVVATDDGALQFHPFRETKGISFNRWFYRLFKISLTDGSSPQNLTGARKIYPLDKTNYKPCL